MAEGVRALRLESARCSSCETWGTSSFSLTQFLGLHSGDDRVRLGVAVQCRDTSYEAPALPGLDTEERLVRMRIGTFTAQTLAEFKTPLCPVNHRAAVDKGRYSVDIKCKVFCLGSPKTVICEKQLDTAPVFERRQFCFSLGLLSP